MEHFGKLDPDPEARAPSGVELRERPRFALMLRSAKLVSSQGEFLCIVRDVSESGVRLKLFNDLSRIDDLALEMSTGDRFGLDRVWSRDGEAGFRFSNPIDVKRFVSEAGPYPKRPVRLRLRHPGQLLFAGASHFATIIDISRQGAGIETDQHLAIGQRMRLEAKGMPGFDATVCWRKHPGYGLVFTQLMSLEELAERTARLQASALAPAPPQTGEVPPAD